MHVRLIFLSVMILSGIFSNNSGFAQVADSSAKISDDDDEDLMTMLEEGAGKPKKNLQLLLLKQHALQMRTA